MFEHLLLRRSKQVLKFAPGRDLHKPSTFARSSSSCSAEQIKICFIYHNSLLASSFTFWSSMSCILHLASTVIKGYQSAGTDSFLWFFKIVGRYFVTGRWWYGVKCGESFNGQNQSVRNGSADVEGRERGVENLEVRAISHEASEG